MACNLIVVTPSGSIEGKEEEKVREAGGLGPWLYAMAWQVLQHCTRSPARVSTGDKKAETQCMEYFVCSNM